MIFKKKQKKLDPKVRFQHKQFTGKLVTARNYKRSASAIPETGFEKILTRIGIGSTWSQIGLGILVAVLLYLIYLPNFLTVKTITISGLSDTQARDLELAIRNEVANTHFFYPEKNLVFLRNKIVYDAAATLPDISTIASIHKSYSKQELVIEAESKYEKFLVKSDDHVYDIFNDGLYKGEAGVSLEAWEGVVNPHMIKIHIPGTVSAGNKTQFLNRDLVKYIDTLNQKLNLLPNFSVAYYEFKQAEERLKQPQEAVVENIFTEATAETETSSQITEEVKPESIVLPINSAEVHAVVYKNNSQNKYRVIFDATKNVQKSVDNLKLLLSQTAPERYSQLSYIDLRLEERAYICLQGAVCNK